MGKAKSCAFLLTIVLALALLIMPFGWVSVSAAESTDTQVTATTSASVKQGNSGYCYVYIDSLEALSTLSVTVHYDADKVKVQSGYVYNSVSSLLNDKSVSESSVQFSYIFDGKGKAKKTQLFYFRYTVLSDAEVGDTYFDIVVNEAYDSSLQPVSVSGSRCTFKVAETVTTKTCSIYSSSSVGASVGEEFEIAYRLSTYQIASGSFTVSYDPELFEVVGVKNGAFCDNKIVDVNTKLAGTVYVSFVGTEYKSNTNLITVKFKTLKNVAEKSTIKMTVTEFYDLALNPISCSGYTTTANITFDETYTEDAPSMTLQTAYNRETDKVTLTVKLDRDSMLGAGDFVLKFDTRSLTYISANKGFSPTFFNINDKETANGILKFSIISLSDITDEQIILTASFDAKHYCQDKTADFEISGSGLTDSLVNTIPLNFVDASVTIPLKHTAAEATEENRVEPTCTESGSYDSVVYCFECKSELSREIKTTPKLGHDHSTEWTVDVAPTCTEEGSKSRHCSRCDDKTEVTVISASGHTYGDWIEVLAPTVISKGVEERNCEKCDHFETRELPVIESSLSRFVPKGSILLSSELIYNVYVPVTELLISFSVDGREYSAENFADISDKIVVLDNGESYYKFEISLPSAEATRSIVLEAILLEGGKSYVGKWNMSIPKYAKKVLDAENSSQIEKKLVCDVLAYVKSAYCYFVAHNTPAEIERVKDLVDSIIGKDYIASPNLDGDVSVSTDGLLAVSIVLNSKPTIRFYIPKECDTRDFSAYIVENGERKNLKIYTSSDNYGKYAEVDVYAYAMCETIYYSVSNTEGSYHISSYYDFALNVEKDEALATLVASFWCYCQSAKAYRLDYIANAK